MPAPPDPRPASALDRLADEYVDLSARLDPFLATSAGIPGHDGEVTDFSPAAEAKRTDAARALLSAIAEVHDPDITDTVETTTIRHEGVPGHHLQVGTQTLQTATLNHWRALLCWVSGHGEGWALYAERLMEQLGHLDDPGDRLGRLDAQRMRAGRVVLDIGLHLDLPRPTGLPGADGGRWTIDGAWEFMCANWGVSEAEQRFELDRYLGWPGQAPSYKVGQRVWEDLRARAAGAGADDRQVRDFHRRALELGSLPLSVLEGAL